MQGVPVKKTRSYGAARIDKSLFRNLSGGEPTLFRVEPGRHTVVVHLSRWIRLAGYRGSSKLSIHVAVQPGEQLKLVCGLRPGAKEEWNMIHMAQLRPIFLTCAGSLLALALRLGPLFFDRQTACPGRDLHHDSRCADTSDHRSARTQSGRHRTHIRGLVCAGKPLILAPNRLVMRSLRYRFLYPYFLKKSEEPLDERQLALQSIGRGRGSAHTEPA